MPITISTATKNKRHQNTGKKTEIYIYLFKAFQGLFFLYGELGLQHNEIKFNI